MGEFSSLSTGAWELDRGDSLRFRVLDAAGNEVAMPGSSSTEDGTPCSGMECVASDIPRRDPQA